MPSPEPPFPSTPTQTAGLLLVSRRLGEAHGLPRASVDQILAATGASREAALETEASILAALEALDQSLSPCGSAPEVNDRGRIDAVTREALGFVMQNPRCTRRTSRGRHSAIFRQFVIELRVRYADVAASQFAEALNLPVSTLDAWIRSRRGVAAMAAQTAPSPL